MATAVKAQEPLDRLQAELNSVLFQVGRVFKTAHSGDQKALHQAKTKAQNGIPQAQTHFSDALDELEKDLTDARSVLNRDLATLRSKRAEREKAAGAARLQNGRSKAVKPDPAAANGKPGQAGGQKAGQASSQPKEGANQQAPPVDTNMGSTTIDIDSMFSDNLGGLAGLGAGIGTQGGQQAVNTNGDAALDTDALFSDDNMNLDPTDFSALTGGGDQDEIQTLLPGLEKYMNQPQDSTGGVNGSNAAAAADDFDLEALLNDMTGGGDNNQSQEASTAPKDNKSQPDSGKDNKNDTAAAASTLPPNTNDNGLGGSGGLDFSNENTFDIDFDDLTGGTGGASTLPGNDDLTDWFNFD